MVNILNRKQCQECTLFYDLTRDSIANKFVKDVYCRCLQMCAHTAHPITPAWKSRQGSLVVTKDVRSFEGTVYIYRSID